MMIMQNFRNATRRTWTIGIVAISAAALTACSPEGQPKVRAQQRAGAIPAAMAKGYVDVSGGLIRITAPRDGVVAKILVEEGDTVTKGQILAVMDDHQAKIGQDALDAELADRKAQLKVSEAKAMGTTRDAARVANLARQDAATRQEAEQAATAAQIAAAEREQARQAVAAAEARQKLGGLEVEVRTIKAPVAGRIVRRSANSGAFVPSAAPILTLEPEGQRVVRAELDETFADNVHPGMRAKVSREFDAEHAFPAQVLRVSPVFSGPALNDDPNARSDTRVVTVVLTLDGVTPMKIGQRVLVRFEK